MGVYKIVICPKAVKQLAKIPEPFRTRLAAAIRDLGLNPRPNGCQKLAGADQYRIRVGNYRAIYEISDTEVVVTVTKTAHRKEVCRP